MSIYPLVAGALDRDGWSREFGPQFGSEPKAEPEPKVGDRVIPRGWDMSKAGQRRGHGVVVDVWWWDGVCSVKIVCGGNSAVWPKESIVLVK